ncbi:Glycosyltransferase involved in cell wall bisynthesis [Oryzisolibacter propanilivorax]|uniref:Glycosyltransferase involved in cell wall bisynthesis n=1 Tax=Oryzisolibacter propanilivorax TaxID=1527607 RepID=A0A1G9S5W4_9BURK|nr:DUF1972 domain-containing protein [Oryzisolibacter propanilivorax]SDM30782.1 Glycosyltransferase involved in cell wall bisynthesis [Oryzisolibacter propanilivorax]
MSAAGAAPAPLLRVAILGTRGIPAGYGGFETFAEQLAVRLAARGHHITVYAEADGRAPGLDRQYHGVRVRQRRRPHWGPASTLAYDCACLWDARRGHDLVYMLGYGAAWACWLPRAFGGTPVWINVDGLEWARSKWGPGARLYLRAMEWLATRSATRLIADARAIAERMRTRYPRGAPCSFAAYGAEEGARPQPEDAALLARWGLHSGGYLLAVARPEPENHVLEIIEGCLAQPGALPLVVVGDVQGRTPYQRRLLAHASERVRFVGGVYQPAQLRCLRLHAAAHLHGHSVGGTNPSLLEALACGNWVIAHDNPFNREVARDAADYFGTPAELARALARHAGALDAERTRRSALARAIVAQHYTWEHITDRYEALMQAQRAGDLAALARMEAPA